MPVSIRSAVACAASAVVAATLTVTPVAAGPQYTITEQSGGLDCSGATSGGLPVSAMLGTSEFGEFAYVKLGPEEAPVLEGFGSGGWEDAAVSFELETFDAHGDPVGSGVVSGPISVVGQTESTEQNRFGNQRVHTFITTQQLEAELSLTVPGYPLLTLDCHGTNVVSKYVRNAPATTNRTERRFFDRVRCEGNGVVGLFGPEHDEYYLSVDVRHAGLRYNMFGVVDPSRDSFSVVLPLRVANTGEEVARIPVTVTMAPTGSSTTNVLRTSIAKVTQVLTPYAVTASAQLPWGSLSSTCEHLEIVTHEIVTAAQGPKPGGPRPGNDLVAGAVRLSAGDAVRTTNRAARLPVEAEMPCADLPPGRSLWYRFRGTGAPMRLDTARSGFDTVLTVYDASLDPLRCADNPGPGAPLPPSTLQARLTVPTVAGRTYFVQVAGGFADHARLVLHAR